MKPIFSLFVFIAMATIYLTVNAVDPKHPGYNGLDEECKKSAKNYPSLSNCACWCKKDDSGMFPKSCSGFTEKYQGACKACREKYKLLRECSEDEIMVAMSMPKYEKERRRKTYYDK